MRNDRGDFTAEVRLLGIAAIAIVVGVLCSVVAVVLLRLIDLFTNLFYYGTLSFVAPHPGGPPPGLVVGAGPGGRRPDHRADGPVRLGADPRARHPRGDGGDPDRPEPDAAQGGGAQAAVVGDLDRLGRARSAPRGRSS